jgi:hypothetical protein
VSVARGDDGIILLKGDCPVEDAEPLLQLLQQSPAARLDWGDCTHLHTAVLQVVLAARPKIVTPCGDAWIAQWIGSQSL